MKVNTLEISKAAIMMAMTSTREEEHQKQAEMKKYGIKTVAVDFGGDILNSVHKIIERAVVASKRMKVIDGSHVSEGAVAGATRDAIMQIATKALGLNVGGKIGISCSEEHLSVCIFMSIGLLHLNEVTIGLAHRSIPNKL